MQRIIGALVTTLAVVVLPQFATAQEGNRPDGPNPERLFNRLDANHDGVITKDEIPATAPERLKNLLREADKNHDGKITKREFFAAVHARHPGPQPQGPGQQPSHPGPQAGGFGPQAGGFGPQAGGFGPQAGHFGPPAGPGQFPGGAAYRPGMPGGPMPNFGPHPNMPGPQPNMPGPHPEGHALGNTNGTGTLVVNGSLIINGGTVIINGGTLVVGGPAGALKGAAVQGCPLAKPVGGAAEHPVLDARAIFSRLDTNHDGKLSFEEFAVGVRHLQQFLATRMGEMKRPLWDGIRSMHERMGQFQGQFGHPGMGPMGGHPGMGPMDGHPGMGPMGIMGSFSGHQGPAVGTLRVQVTMGPDGTKKVVACKCEGMKKPEVCKCGAKKGEPCKCREKKAEVCKCGAKKGEPCKCREKKAEVCKCGAKKGEPCKCGVKKHEAEKPAAGHESIEARLTALESQQAEILKLLKSVTKHDHHGRGER
jgi:Ca2+-binding EF-hand superfamily protein